MTSVDNEGAIVLGVGPQGHLSEGAVAFAVATARQLGVGIEVVHVMPATLGGPTGNWEVSGGLDRFVSSDRDDLDGVVQRVRERMGGEQPVSGEMARGRVVPSLLDRSARAQMVVLEHRRLGRWDRLTHGSVVARVAARTHVPVVSVPASWQPAREVLPVTVAVEDAKLAEAALWTALGAGAVSGVPVVALRASRLDPVHPGILRREAQQDELLLAAALEFERDTNLRSSVREAVPCTFEVRWGRPAEVLVDATHRSSLLVIARRDPALPFCSRLGPVVRTVLRDAECPVMVVEPSLAHPFTIEPVSAAASVRQTTR